MWSQEYMANVEKVGEKFLNKLYCQKKPPYCVTHSVTPFLQMGCLVFCCVQMPSLNCQVTFIVSVPTSPWWHSYEPANTLEFLTSTYFSKQKAFQSFTCLLKFVPIHLRSNSNLFQIQSKSKVHWLYWSYTIFTKDDQNQASDCNWVAPDLHQYEIYSSVLVL